jgi:hypothetical protein
MRASIMRELIDGSPPGDAFFRQCRARRIVVRQMREGCGGAGSGQIVDGT